MIDSAKTKNSIFNHSNSSSKKQHISVNDNKKIEDFFSPKIRNSNSNPNSNCNTNDSSLNEKESFLDVKPKIIEHTFINKKRLEPLLDKNANIKEKNIKEKQTKIIEKKNNNTCSICKDGGELIMCDKCPRSFHIECLKLDESELPEGKWFCPKCVLNKQQNHMNVKIHKKLKLHSPQHNNRNIKQNNNNVNSFQNLNINLGESFPIKDKDLYANSDKYSLTQEQINKFKGNILFDNITIPSSYQHKIIMIYDYLYSFASYLQFNTDFTLNQLYLSFCNKDSQIYNSILIAFAYLFVSNIQSQTYSDLLSEDNMFQDENISNNFNINDIYTLYKVIADNANIKLFTNDTFQLILYHVFCNQNENDLAIKILDNNLNNPCDKIDIIEKLIYFSYDTDYFRDVIKKCLEKRNEIKKKLKDAEEEFKPLENKRKELERQEQFTQPKLKLENIEIAICEIYKVDSTESRSEKAKKRKQYEKEKEKYLNEIKELEKLNVKINEHKKKINAIKQELNQINSITSNSNSKCIGTDVTGSKYMYFFWDINRIYIKANDGYYYNVLCTMENISKLKTSLSIKGIKEKQLLQKLDKLFTSSNLIVENNSTNEENIVDNNNMVMDIEYIQNIPSLVSLLNRLHVVENNFSTYLQKQNNQIWESESIKKQLKNWVNKQGNINNIRGIISYIELLVTNLIRPYENIDNNNKVIIIDDDDEENEEQSIQDLTQYISHNENGDTLNKFKNPLLTFSKLRSSLFTKDYENNGIDHIYTSYLSNLSNIINHNHLYLELQVSILFLEALYNCTLLDKGNKNNQTNNILHSLDEYEYKTKKKSYWNDHCMICGEYGNVICCEKCPNVIHLFCSGISRMPDKWYCDECNSSMKYKRITRSKGICVYD